MSQTQGQHGAIAIVGMSCRFAPNLTTPEALWEFLMESRTSVTSMPPKRWRPYAETSPEATNALRATTLLGSYLDDIEGFDADFFGITPKEAAYLDPQQRFMLELTWEALADAGIPPTSLRGTDASVYAAVNSTDYGRRVLEDMGQTGPYAVNGTTDYGIANRVSYFLDTRGPSMAVNTACAATLTAVHLASQALSSGETSVAIVGGLNIISTPALNVALGGAGALAPDGQSKAYDEAADGYGRGEGAGVLVLKRLDDAQRDQDRVLAVLRGSGVYQDGRSDGMMAPNADAQAHMLGSVYRRAGIDPASVSYVEAHGTGTPAGDAAELSALARVIGAERSEPCVVGSIKPNIGHVEGGSGMAGIIKVILALNHDAIPPSLHGTATSRTDWETNGLRLPRGATDWPAGEMPRRAGVSNYGVGGTIAHVIIEEAPATEPRLSVPPSAATTRPVLIPISSMSAQGASQLAGAVGTWLSDHMPQLHEVQHTLQSRRSHLPERVAVVTADVPHLTTALTGVGAGHPASSDVVTGRAVQGAEQGAVWVFSGHGSQWEGMGRDLLDVDPAFTALIDELGTTFQEELGWTPRQRLDAAGPWSTTEVQALTFAMQVALAASWQSAGFQPAAVIGHSVGEIAAAHVAGALGLVQAARFACRRARALEQVAGSGAMAVVALPFDQVAARLADVHDVVAAIAASPSSTVISGEQQAVARVIDAWAAEGLAMRLVATDLAFHSPLVDPVIDTVVRGAANLQPRAPKIPLYSTTLPDPRGDSPRDGAYWAQNLRAPVRFSAAVSAAIDDGYRLFLEVSAHPIVSHSVLETAETHGVEIAALAMMRRAAGNVSDQVFAQATAFVAGLTPIWAPSQERSPLAMPGAAWQHRPYWLFEESAASGFGPGHDPSSHDLLGGSYAVSGLPIRQVWQTRLDMETRPYPLDHALDGVEVTPAASILNSFLKAAGGHKHVALNNVVLRTPLAVEPPRTVQLVREGSTISLFSRVAERESAGGEDWILHSSAVIGKVSRPLGPPLDAERLLERLPAGDWQRLEDMFRNMGVGGYAFPWHIEDLHRSDEEQFAVLTLTDDKDETTSWAHVIDSALTISAPLVTPIDAQSLWMSRAIERVMVDGEPPARLLVHSRRTPSSPHDSVDVDVANTDGRIVAVIRGLAFAPIDNLYGVTRAKDLVHDVVWRQLEPGSGTSAFKEELGTVAVIGSGPRAYRVAQMLRDAGVSVADSPSVSGANTVILVAAPNTVVDPGETIDLTHRLITHTLAAMDAATAVIEPRVWILTEGARDPVGLDGVSQRTSWGLGRIIAGEHPQVWGGVLDVASLEAVPSISIAEVLASFAGVEDVIHVAANGTASVPRLQRMNRISDAGPLRCSPSGSVLVTGGLGALGLEAAQWLSTRGVRRLILAGRRGLPTRRHWAEVSDPSLRHAIEVVRSLEQAGVAVRIVSLDITDGLALRDFVAKHDADNPPITGVVHAAGGIYDDLVDNITHTGISQVFGAKALGAWNLHEAFPPGSLDFFVAFSSCGQFARLSGQGAYAAANSFLDGLMEVRVAAGEAGAVSLGWTSWRGLGLSADLSTTMLEGNMRGLDAVSGQEALQAWAFADHFSGAYKAILKTVPPAKGVAVPPMFRDLTHDESEHSQEDTFELDPAMDAVESRQLVTSLVHAEVATELSLAESDLGIRRPLVDLGVDSVMAVALRVRLQRRFAVDFPSTILWAKPTVYELGGFVHDALQEALDRKETGWEILADSPSAS